MYKVTRDALFADRNSYFEQLRQKKVYRFSGERLGPEYRKIAESLITTVPKELYSYSDPIGSPDAHDQGGYYIEIIRGERAQKWHIDPTKHPPELKNFLRSISKTISDLKTAERQSKGK